MKAIFKLPFENDLPNPLDANGHELILGASRTSEPYEENGQLVNTIQIEASEAIINQLKADPDYEWVEDVVE